MTNVARERHEEGAKAAECDLLEIRIILTTDDNENGMGEPGLTWHPGDPLEGSLQISSSVMTNIIGIHVFFEGMVSGNLDG
jgi:hypothetical protein